jgi:GNAT superfamily N-acetyltransferase
MARRPPVRSTIATFRAATDADIGSEHQVFCRAEGGLRLLHGFAWVDPPIAWFAAITQHLLSNDPERCFVAEADGQVVGFSAAFVRDGVWFLAALFIHPDHQGKGIGRQLFELAVLDAPPRRITITDAIQAVSNGLYARHGLIPTTPMLQFEGVPSIEAPAILQPDRPAPGELAALDRSGYGFDRSADHELWTKQRRCTVWRRDGVAVAYAYRGLTGSIGPLVGRDPASAADALRAELARVSRASLVLPGSARSLVEVAVEARLKLVPPPGNLLLSEKASVPNSLAISGYFLY